MHGPQLIVVTCDKVALIHAPYAARTRIAAGVFPPAITSTIFSVK